MKDLFDIAYESGAETTIMNRQGLTTMTLAAQMAKKQMFFHILNINRDVYWRVGKRTIGILNTTCHFMHLHSLQHLHVISFTYMSL